MQADLKKNAQAVLRAAVDDLYKSKGENDLREAVFALMDAVEKTQTALIMILDYGLEPDRR